MRDMLVIARRELLERVRSKWFIAITLLGPIGMVAMVVIPMLIAAGSTEGTKVDIVDKTGKVAAPLADNLRDKKWIPNIIDASTSDDVELEKIRTKQINGFITIPADGLTGGGIVYRGDNASSQAINIELLRSLQVVVIKTRAGGMGLRDEQLAALTLPIDFSAKHTTGEVQGTSGLVTFFLGYILAFILYMVITLYGVGVMRAVVQEKTSRVMEMMVAVVKPNALMGGKILGVGAAGLIQVTVWLAMGALTINYRSEIAGWFGATGGGPQLPPLALAEIAVVLAYFLIGFFFYAAMYAAVGAMVSSDQDTQQMQVPLTMILVVGILCLQVVSNDPRGSSAQIMTMIPLWSPMLMPMRYVLGGATLGDLALSLGILLVSTVLIVRAAAKIYRIGVLMYGKRPSVRELIRWLRY
jgi:ABC-2 type transport system permease protein